MHLTLQLSFDAFPPALNGANGLIRMHFHQYKKEREAWIGRIRAALTPAQRELFAEHTFTEVKVMYERRSIHREGMDWDNMAASFKIPSDALVHAGILADDSPAVITAFTPRQSRVAHRNKQGISIVIEGTVALRKPGCYTNDGAHRRQP